MLFIIEDFSGLVSSAVPGLDNSLAKDFITHLFDFSQETILVAVSSTATAREDLSAGDYLIILFPSIIIVIYFLNLFSQ